MHGKRKDENGDDENWKALHRRTSQAATLLCINSPAPKLLKLHFQFASPANEAPKRRPHYKSMLGRRFGELIVLVGFIIIPERERQSKAIEARKGL